MDFSTWIAAGLMVVVGVVWVIVYNADLLLGAAAAVLGRIRALAPILRMAMAYPLRRPLPHRRHARHVHPRGLHARDRHGHVGLVHARGRRRRAIRRRVRRAGEHGRRRADRRPAGGDPARRRRSTPPTSRWPPASPSCPWTRASSAPAGPPRPTRSAASTTPSSARRPSPSGRGRAATPATRRSGARSRGGPGSRSWTRRSCPAGTSSASTPCRRTSGSAASSSRTRASPRSPSR